MESPDPKTPNNPENTHATGVYPESHDVPKSTSEFLIFRTMKGDITDAIKNQDETLVSIALSEEKGLAAQRAESEKIAAMAAQAIETPAPKRIERSVVVGVVILILAVLGLAYQFLLPKLLTINTPSPSLSGFENTITEPISVAPRIPLAYSLIPAHFEKRFIINQETPEKIFSDIADERTATGSNGKIKNLYFTEEFESMAISANRLLILAGVKTPEILARSLEAPFMAGLLNEESSTTATPFLILKVSDYDTSFAGMLQWEQNIPLLIDTIFGTNITDGLSNDTRMLDVVLLGRDARMLEIAPNIGIAYAFANKQTIVIAGSQTALEHIIPLVK